MRLHHTFFLLLNIFLVPGAQASDVSWIFHPGYYTHSPVTGQRVAQYEPEQPSIVPVDPTYQESGYQHQLIQLGTDYLNLVQTWGAGTAIRPYGEWERPYRPGATPYGPWGNPQGPWTLPYLPWHNPYGPNRPPYVYGGSDNGNGPMNGGPMGGETWQPGQQAAVAPVPQTFSSVPPRVPAQPTPHPTAPRGQSL